VGNAHPTGRLLESTNGKSQIKVEKGKSGKQRCTLLSKMLLKQLRGYYKTCRPKTYLFPSGYKKHQMLCYESVRCIYENARKKNRR
jgi:integrase